jgi:hypothetical protein
VAFVPLAGFVPDADPTTPGILLECNGWIPTPKGMKAAPTPADAGYAALGAACVGFYFSRLTDGTAKCYAGTAANLYELGSGTWTDRTGTALTTGDHWRWATLGNVTYASNIYNKIRSATTGNFGEIAEAPKAACLATAFGFLIAGNYNDGSAVPDGVYWSAQYNPDDWTADVATQCGYIRLLDTPGPITALRTLSEQVVAYKERSMYLGVYQAQGPYFWVYRLLSPDIGAVSQEAVVDVGYAHFFVGYNDIWIFDGSVPRSIGPGIREWFFREVDRANISKVHGLYDRDRALVYWWYPVPGGGGALTKYIVYNVMTQKWGAGTLTVECTGEALTPSATWDTWAGTSLWSALFSSTWDAGTTASALPYPAVFTSAHKLAYLSGAASSASLTTGRVGAEDQVALLRRVAPRWFLAPSAASLVNYYAQTPGAVLTQGATTSMGAKKRFDVLRAARWHALKLSVTGDAELAGITVDAVPQGLE